MLHPVLQIIEIDEAVAPGTDTPDGIVMTIIPSLGMGKVVVNSIWY